MEVTLVALIFAGAVVVASFFFHKGYLPPPFFYDTDDTFMDWYNTAHWVYYPSTYTIWGSIYPPISFLFLRMFSNPACYASAGVGERACDPLGIYVLAAFIFVNTIVAFLIYRKNDRRTAIPRALAVGLGLPMLVAWERGNLILPCFTFYMLGHSRLLKSAILRSACVGVFVNFKPYLVLTLIGSVLKRRWRRAEACGVAIVVIYLATYALFGAGSPSQLLQNTFGFVYTPPNARIDGIIYSQTYNGLLELLRGPFPIMEFIGSRPMETAQSLLPQLMKVGEIGVLACFAGAVWRPASMTAHRLAALTLALLLTVTEPGGYAQVFLFFLVFLEPMKGIWLTVTVVSAYLLCIPCDLQIVHVLRQQKESFLSGLTVTYDVGLTLGAFVRPAILLVLEYALVVATLIDVFRSKPPQKVRAIETDEDLGPGGAAIPAR